MIRRRYTILAWLILGCILGVLLYQNDFSPQLLLSAAPEHPLTAALFMLGLFALKSLSVVLPLWVLYLTAGLLFSPVWAILVSLFGLVFTFTIPYLLGWFQGPDAISQMRQRFPKADQFSRWQDSRPFFFSFFSRQIGILPGDLVSVYLGACHIPYPAYLLGGICGSLCSLLTTVLVGQNLRDPFSPAFWGALILRVIVAVGSMFWERYWTKSKS